MPQHTREDVPKNGPSRHLCLYGTEEEPQATRIVRSGALTATLQSGNLRHLSIGEREAIRGIAFVVRDENWGTYVPRISNLEVSEDYSGFRIRYRGECADARQSLAYEAVIDGSADGNLEFSVTGRAGTPFRTNRAGFVVLHPVVGVAGTPVTVTHTDGSEEGSVFPELIQPSQPFTDIRSLRHAVAPGLWVTVTMEGGIFEMEDQRNWTDASYKTYIRPLSEPFPYTLEPGREFHQRVSVRIEGPPPQSHGIGVQAPIEVTIGNESAGTVPAFALALHPDHLATALDATHLVRRTGVGHIVCTFDASRGHDAETMAQFRRFGEESGTGLILEAVLPLRDGRERFTDDPDVLESDLAAVRCSADDASAVFETISVSPACYLESWQPSGPWPSAPPLRDVYAATRRVFPGARIAGGMHGYFTEFNRYPPPADEVDIVTHSTCPIVHAADESSVMETLQALPRVFESVRRLAGGKPHWIGPTAIGMRFNPYGFATTPNPGNVRSPMVTADPRQRGIFNAAWTLGYVARAAAAGVAGLCLSAPTGPFGIVWRKADWHQPWFDEHGSESTVFPVYHVVAGLASRAGATVNVVACSDPATLAVVAIDAREGRDVWLANLTPGRQTVNLGGIAGASVIERLDVETFESCCSGPDGFSATAERCNGSSVSLDPYAVLRISGAGP